MLARLPRRVAPGLVVVLALAAAALPGRALAGGFYVPDVGTRNLGRGGASVVGADDLTALWYNPAALLHGKDPLRVTADVSFVDVNLDFDRADQVCREGLPGSCIDRAHPAVSTDHFPYVIPFLGIGSDLGLEHFAFAFGAYGPYTGLYSYPGDGAQRYSATATDIVEMHLQLGAAWDAIPGRLAVGATVENVQIEVRNDLVLGASDLVGMFTGGGTPEDPQYDIPIGVDVADRGIFSWTVGVTAQPHDRIQVGASFRPGYDVHADGTLKVELPDALGKSLQDGGLGFGVQGEKISLDFQLPWIARAGVRFLGERWDVEVDYLYEAWSAYDRIELTGKDVVLTAPFLENPLAVDNLTLDKRWRDSFGVRLGGHYAVTPWLEARAGYSFDESAIPGRQLDAMSMDGPKHGAGLGLSVRWRDLSLDLAYQHTFMPARTVRDTAMTQLTVDVPPDLQAVLPGPVPAPTVLGNGRYAASYDIFSVGLSGALSSLWQEREEP